MAWRSPWTVVHGVAKSRTRLSNFHFTSDDISGSHMEPCANFQELYVSTWKTEDTGSRDLEPVTPDPAECGSHGPAANYTCHRAARWPLLTGQRAQRNQERGSSISRKIIPTTSLLCHRSPPEGNPETDAGAVWIRVRQSCPGVWGMEGECWRKRECEQQTKRQGGGKTVCLSAPQP